VEGQEWSAVVRLGDDLLRQDDVPGESSAQVRRWAGIAHFMLGRPSQALPLLESGIDGAPPGVDLTVDRYFAGMSAMMLGDLTRARRWLRTAIADPDPDSWALDAARRGLAQVEAELGDLPSALSAIEAAPMRAETHLLNELIRARIELRAGRDDQARVLLHAAALRLPEEPDDASPAQNATVASMLVSVAADYVELGHPAEASRAVREARRRFELAERTELQEAAYLPLLDAEVSRLEGALDDAEEHLARAGPASAGPADLGPLLLRARARIAWSRGDEEQAPDLWSRAVEGFEAIDHRWLAAATRDELLTGPPRPAPHPDVDDLMRPPPDWQLPDGLQISFAVTPDHGTDAERDELMAFAEELGAQIETRGLGELDGWGSGGGTFELFLLGDPERLWEVAEPGVRDLAARYATTAVIQRGGEERTVDLAPGGAARRLDP
jgi:tetratricopeptide (TPR) repeat protein